MKYDPLFIRQLEQFYAIAKQLKTNKAIPKQGWITTIRNALCLSGKQLGKKLGISQQSITQLEQNERDYNITLKSLKSVAEALDCSLYYVFIPNHSLEETLEKQALKKAEQIYKATTHTMSLEEQSVSPEETKLQIKELATQLKLNATKTIWDI